MACMKTALLLLFVYFCGNGVDVEAKCPWNDIDFPGHDITWKTGVPSWESCGTLCAANKACQFWTWVSDKYSSAPVRRRCYLKRASANKKPITRAGLVSGSSKCTAKCPENDIDRRGHDIALKTGVSSWESCGKLCAANKACHFWTWASDKYKSAAARRRCYLKSASATKSIKILGVISGSSKCAAKETTTTTTTSFYSSWVWVPADERIVEEKQDEKNPEADEPEEEADEPEEEADEPEEEIEDAAPDAPEAAEEVAEDE